MNKVAIFVDVQNIYYTTRQAFGRNFDYRTFWSRVTAGRKVIAAFAYAIERDDGKQKAFQQILRDIGCISLFHFEISLRRGGLESLARPLRIGQFSTPLRLVQPT